MVHLDDADVESKPTPLPRKRVRMAVAWFAAVAVLATCGVMGAVLWKDRTDTRRDDQSSQQYLQAARQAVLNLTTISAATVDADTKRVLDDSTGSFRDDFTQRSNDFTAVVKQANVSAVGTITEAGIESMSDNSAQILVAATSTVSNSAGAAAEPRIWHLRVTMQRTEGKILMSKVDFVP